MATTAQQMSIGSTPTAQQLFPDVRQQVPEAAMRVKKRNGALEPVDVSKIIRAVQLCAAGLSQVDPMRIAVKTIGGLYDGSTTRELDQLNIQTAASLIAEEPEYSRLAGRLLANFVEKEVAAQNIYSFSQSIEAGYKGGLIGDECYEFVKANARKLNSCIDDRNTDLFEYFGIRTVYDRYLLKNPESRDVIETPQYFFLRVACGLSVNVQEAIEFYKLISAHDYMPSSPTLFNSGTKHPQMSSCYLLDSPEDNLEGIYERYKDVAMLSKFAGGIGLAYHRIRARGSLIRGTNGRSNGIVPWLKTLDSSVCAVNQGGKRKGAACVYLEPWHADIEEFLELRDNTGDEARRTYNLNLSNWIPDIFMKRVDEDGVWSLFDPKVTPHFTDLYGPEFEAAYIEAESKGLFMRQMKARDMYARMMKTLAETGNGWMTFKDACNLKNNQTGQDNNVIHLSNLCTEITEITNQGETAVCNLGSVNLARYVNGGEFDFEKLAYTVQLAVRFLDKVIDINYYPTKEAGVSNAKWRPVGLGIMGLQDVFFQLRLAFDSEKAKALSRQIQEEIYYSAMVTTIELAEQSGPFAAFEKTRAAKGAFQFDLWGVTPSKPERWEALRPRMMKSGMRNSLMIAIAPTATIASIVGSYECIEPQISNLFKRETLSGDFIQINRYLVNELKALGLWNEDLRNRVKMGEGSVQNIDEIPQDIKDIYRTVWEVPMRALIDMGAERGPYIDQSQSLNLFIESPTIGKVSSMYMYAWKKGLKTTYYLRSRPASKISKATVPVPASVSAPVPVAQAIACSLENPESCEACQ